MQLAQHIAHLAIPRHSNNHKAKVLHSSVLTLLSIAVLIFQLGLNSFSHTEGAVLGYAANISPAEVIKITNEKRIEAGLSPLKENTNLSQAAAAKGAHMLSNDYWAHVAPDGTQPWKFFADIGYKYKYAGENLARDFSNASSAVSAWMASPTHRENMLSPKYKEIGIGVVEGDLGGVDTTIIVQFFGTTLVDSLAPEPVAAAASTAKPVISPRATAKALAAVVPSIKPSPIPSPVNLTTANNKEDVLPQPVQTKVLISPFLTSKGLSTAVVALLLMMFVLDIIIISQRRIKRISGRSFAHVAFLGVILIIVLIIQVGKII